MTSLLFILGVAAICAGVALWSVPAALVVGGSITALMAVLLERGAAGPTEDGDVA